MIENYKSIDEFFMDSNMSYKDVKNLKDVLHHHVFTSIQKIDFSLIPYEDTKNKDIIEINENIQKEIIGLKKFFK